MTAEDPPNSPQAGQVRARITRLREEVLDIAADIRQVATSDPTAAFAEAGHLIATLGECLETGGTVRAQAAKGIHEKEALSLSGLAKRIGVSKARADQLINAAKAAEKETPQP